jgi:hypothetical protein
MQLKDMTFLTCVAVKSFSKAAEPAFKRAIGEQMLRRQMAAAVQSQKAARTPMRWHGRPEGSATLPFVGRRAEFQHPRTIRGPVLG